MSDGGPPRSLGTKLARGFLACSPAAAAYGACIRTAVEGNLAKDVCKQQFEQLRQCFNQFSKKAAGK